MSQVEFKMLPEEIKLKMLEHQKEQTGRSLASAFSPRISTPKSEGGFDWDKTEEGYMFWEKILRKGDFAHFYTAYPEKSFPRIMKVSEDLVYWEERVVFAHKCDKWIAWTNASTFEEADKTLATSTWRYAKELEAIIEVTIDEIAKLLKVHPSKVKIVKSK